MTTPDGSKQYCTMVEWLKNKYKFLEENAEDYELSEWSCFVQSISRTCKNYLLAYVDSTEKTDWVVMLQLCFDICSPPQEKSVL